jgi:zinc and cadmium transporter
MLYAIIAVILVSLVSLIGIFTLGLKRNLLKRILFLLVSFSVGSLLGGAFIHLIPESFENYGFGLTVPLLILLGFIVFFVMEKFIHWRHCHTLTSSTHKHPVGLMNLVGDGLHNFTDGVLIAASFMVDTSLGVATTVAVLMHEIPQEIGDFGILLHAGYSRFKAILFNLLSGLVAILGVVVVWLVGTSVEGFAMWIVPITAGGFIYIAGSDLVPELHKECAPRRSFLQFVAIVLGILIMVGLTYV